MPYEIVDDPSDHRLSDYVGLSDPQIRRWQESERFFIAEGVEVVRRLIASDLSIRSIVIAPNRFDAMRDALEHVRCPVYIAERSVMSSIVGFDLHRGVVASGSRPAPVTLAETLSRPALFGGRHRIAALHGVADHENLGAIVRSARAFHIDVLVLDPTCADPYYRRTVRVSMGEIFSLPVVSMPTSDLIGEIRERRGTSVAMTPRREAESIDEIRTDSGPLALIFGSEGFGLPEEVLGAADIRARIPIAADVDSLNVGHAAAIAFASTMK